jgi:hypothetical protein
MDGEGHPAVEFMNMIQRRRLIALVAAYAIALQAVLSGFVALAMTASPDICAPAAGGTLPAPPNSDCGCCHQLCGGDAFAGVPPGDLAMAAPAPLRQADNLSRPVAPPTPPRLLPPSRAPPAAA